LPVRAETTCGRFQVRQPCDVEIIARSDRALEAGDTVEAQFPNSWLLVSGPSFTRQLQCQDPRGQHYVAVECPGADARFEIAIRPRNLPFTGASARHGRHIVATLAEGRVPRGQPVRIRYANTFAPYVAETEEVWLRVGAEAPDAAPQLVVTPGPARTLRVIAPSFARPGAPFGVLVVSLDEFDNVSCTRYEGQTLLCDDAAPAAEGLSFTGSVRVPVTVTTPGVCRFRLGEALSNAVRVGREHRGPYWGDIHIHTKISQDGQGTDPYRYARDASGLDFAGVADHCQSSGQAGCDQILQWARDAYVPGEFVTILGDEREPADFSTPDRPNHGHYNAYCRDEESFRRTIGSPGEAAFVNPLAKAGAPLDPAEIMFVPHHTGIVWRDLTPQTLSGGVVDFADALDGLGLRPVIEIYSHHGQSELYSPQHVLAYELNRMRNPERRANTSFPGPHYARDYWMAGRRVGVIGSSDEHSGQGGRRHGGLAAVWADELTREGIFDALRQRRCYATTGERILVDFSVGGAGMGQCRTAQPGEPLAVHLGVWGTALLVRVEVLRFRFGQDQAFVPVLSAAPRPESMDASFDFEEAYTGPCMYYARILQEPLPWPGMAWTSPVWIDE